MLPNLRGNKMPIEQNEEFQNSYRKLIYTAEKQGQIKLGVSDKFLLKNCLKEIFLKNSLENSVKGDPVSEAISTYSQKYSVLS